MLLRDNTSIYWNNLYCILVVVEGDIGLFFVKRYNALILLHVSNVNLQPVRSDLAVFKSSWHQILL